MIYYVDYPQWDDDTCDYICVGAGPFETLEHAINIAHELGGEVVELPND